MGKTFESRLHRRCGRGGGSGQCSFTLGGAKCLPRRGGRVFYLPFDLLFSVMAFLLATF